MPGLSKQMTAWKKSKENVKKYGKYKDSWKTSRKILMNIMSKY